MSDDKLRDAVKRVLGSMHNTAVPVEMPIREWYDELNTALADSATAEHRWSEDKIPPGVRYCVLCVETEDVAGRKCNGPPRCTGCGSVSWAWRDQKVRRCSKCATADVTGEMVGQAKVLSAALKIHRDVGRNLCWISGRAVAVHALEQFRALATAQPDKAGGPDGVPEGPKDR